MQMKLNLRINMEEFESLRHEDYQEIQKKKAAKIMDISQPIFHPTLGSAMLENYTDLS